MTRRQVPVIIERMNTSTKRKTWDQRLFTVLWIWMTIRTIIPWLVTYRLTLEGDGYSWGSSYFGRMFHSSGLARPDFLVIYILLALSLFLMWQLRNQRFRLAAPLLVAFLGFFAADAVYELMAGEPVMFHGDTLGVHLNVSVLFFVLQFGLFAIALAWWYGVRDIDRGPGPQPLTNLKRWLVRLCVVLAPIQIMLLVAGEPHAMTDEIGVILTILQWLFLAYALYPGSNYRRIIDS
jgi:hypothetical protein